MSFHVSSIVFACFYLLQLISNVNSLVVDLAPRVEASQPEKARGHGKVRRIDGDDGLDKDDLLNPMQKGCIGEMCVPRPNRTKEGKKLKFRALYSDVKQDEVIELAHGVGGWGGSCTCPHGAVYQVGDYGGCASMACHGGQAGECQKSVGVWSNRKVTCHEVPDLLKKYRDGDYLLYGDYEATGDNAVKMMASRAYHAGGSSSDSSSDSSLDEDDIVARAFDAGNSIYDEDEKEERLAPACREPIPEGNRVMLMPVVAQFHGSTALEGVFMSSPSISTMCSSNVWQCESHFIYENRHQNVKNATDLLETYSQYWNLDQKVYFDKGPRDLKKIRWEQKELEREKQDGIPASMKKAGVKNLFFVYVLMWRPVCLSKLSHNARNMMEKDQEGFAYQEMLLLEDMVEAHRYLDNFGYKIMVLNLADMMWKTDRANNRIKQFLPCLGELDFDFTPVLGKDIFPGNAWKADGSLKAFGASTNPWECCSYAVEEQKCYDDADFFQVLPDELQERASKALEYLMALS